MKRGRAFSNKLLKILVVGGVVTVAAVNPFFGLLAAKVIEEELKKRKWKRFQDDLYYLKSRGFVKVYSNPDGSYRVRPTIKGRHQVKRYNLEYITINIPRKWDQCRRLVVFDIPTSKQKTRLALLSKLKELGFVILQRSIWAHPFECKNEIAVLARTLEAEQYIHQLTYHEISAWGSLRQDFEKRNSIVLI